MARGKINSKTIRNKIFESTKFKRQIDSLVNKKIDEIKRATLQEFDSHPITVEIEAGASSKNSSGTLGGYGNLFSFIGFSSNASPTSALRGAINKSIAIRRLKGSGGNKKQIQVSYKVTLPSKGLIEAVTPMPWEGGSWVEAVENGMSNFSYYMYKRFGEGRSGWGFQADHNLRSAIFQPKAYVSEILANFQRSIKQIK
jgi:hypothetical protein